MNRAIRKPIEYDSIVRSTIIISYPGTHDYDSMRPLSVTVEPSRYFRAIRTKSLIKIGYGMPGIATNLEIWPNHRACSKRAIDFDSLQCLYIYY